MATEPKGDPTPSAPLKRLGSVVTRWFEGKGAPEHVGRREPALVDRRPASPMQDGWDDWLADPVSLQALAGTQHRQLRSRQQIYEKWQDMMADTVIMSGLSLHATAALGGHESMGKMIFIEATPEAKKDKKLAAFVESLAKDLEPIFNLIAPTVTINAIGYGDAYGRLYSTPGEGLRDIYVDELVLPSLVQAYERGNTTIGFTVATGERYFEKLTVLQMARVKMPRKMYVPQSRVMEKSVRVSLREDDVRRLPAVPAVAGGSFLDGVEGAYDKFAASWAGLTGQRVQDSIAEVMVGVQQTGMSPEQRKTFKKSLVEMFERTNAYINAVVKRGKPVFGKIFHFIPTSGEKQVAEIRAESPGQRPASLTIEDVMMNARFLAGGMGLDLSALGFSDQLAGGFGGEGFFRVSAQSAERSRAVRAALTPFFDHCTSVHALMKHGLEFSSADQPWQINFAGNISALAAENERTSRDKRDAGTLLATAMAQVKDLGLDEPAIANFLEKEMALDAKDAQMYAKAMAKAIKEAAAREAAGGFGGGGFGGGFPGDEPASPDGSAPGEGGEGGDGAADGPTGEQGAPGKAKVKRTPKVAA
jgi:hypothetical protein